MKLYDCERNRWVRPVVEASAPPSARVVDVGEPVLFHHTDGMYSYCHDKDNNVVHLPAWQEVEYVEQ